MRIGQLAQRTGVTPDTLRYYEKIGLLRPAPRRDSGYRDYAEDVSERVRVIRNAAQLGFPLKEIAKVLRVRDAGGAPCRQVREYARGLVDEIEQQIAGLERQRQAMLALIGEWDGKLAQTAPGTRAHLLDGGATGVPRSPSKQVPGRRTR